MIEEAFLKKLGSKISALRRKNGLSQSDLGALINMEKSNLSAIENGRQNASSLTLKKIADAIQCEVKQFFDY